MIIFLKEDLRLPMGIWGWEEVYLEIKFNKGSLLLFPLAVRHQGLCLFTLYFSVMGIVYIQQPFTK